MADLSLNIIGNNLATDAIKGVVGNIKGMGDAVADFAADSVKMYAESQRAITQLNRVAGDATDAFVEQATQMQNTLGVSDDMVLGLQRLTLTFGAAQAQVEPTTRAVLDYAAATGKDATAAMEMLIRGVDGGTGEIKKLGISFETTGDRTKDLAAATEALSAKYGGAAAADANTLAGRARIAKAAMEDLQKSFGGLITDFIAGSGAVEKVTFAVKELQYAMSAEKADLDAVNERTEAMIVLKGQLKQVNDALGAGAFGDGSATGGMTKAQLEMRKLELEMRMKALDIVKQEREAKMAAGLSAVGSGDLTSGAKGAQQEAAKSAASAYAKDMQEAAVANARAAAQAVTDAQVDGEKAGAAELAAVRAQADTEAAAALAQVHIAQRLAMSEQQDAMLKAEADLWYDFGKQTATQLNQTRDNFANAGTDIGVALVNSLGAELAQLAEGGEMDLGSFFGDLISTIGGVVGTVVGAFNPLLGAAVGAGSSLLGAGIKGATRKKKHDGGWMERYHAGGWPGLSTEEVPAILQAGERVLSRGEVGRMGGPAGVDAAAREGGGGAGTVINVSVVDGENFRQFVEGKGGRAIYNANRVGRGMLPGLLGGG